MVQPSTDEPGEVFAPGSRVFAIGVGPRMQAAEHAEHAEHTETTPPTARALIVERSRPFKNAWLVKLVGVDDKTAADRWRGVTFLVPQDELSPPDEDANEVYLHELVGMQARDAEHGHLGVVAGWYTLPQGLVLEVRGSLWRADVPFNDAFVTKVDRAARVIDLQLPDGLVEPTRDSPLSSPDSPLP